jgi:hypothetical protein
MKIWWLLGAAVAAGCGGEGGGLPEGPVSAGEEVSSKTQAITRDETIARAQQWVDVGMPYCGGVNGGSDVICGGTCVRTGASDNPAWNGYRSDCSGYVSWAWGLPGPGRVTGGFAPFDGAVSHEIAGTDLAPGDALNNSHHVALFAGWVDKGAGKATLMEELNCDKVAMSHEVTLVADGSSTVFSKWHGENYTAIRYNAIDDTPKLAAEFVGQGSDAPADPEGLAYFRVCAGAPVKFWFELRNVGSASWVDWGDNGNDWGQRVRLGSQGDMPDPFTGGTRVSLNSNASNDVHPPSWSPPGDDCNDHPTCRRTVFSKDGGIQGTAPATPGVYQTSWQLVDEGRAWFGPGMYLSFHVVDCAPPPDGKGGAGGDPGSAGGGQGQAGAQEPGGAGGAASQGGSPAAGHAGTLAAGHAGTPAAGQGSSQAGHAGAAGHGGVPSAAGQGGAAGQGRLAGASVITEQAPSDDSGGCSAGRGQGGGWSVILGVLGARAIRRRRR